MADVKLEALVALAKAKDVKGLTAFEINPTSTAHATPA